MTDRIKTPDTTTTVNAPAISPVTQGSYKDATFFEGFDKGAVSATKSYLHDRAIDERARSKALLEQQNADKAAHVVDLLSGEIPRIAETIKEGVNPLHAQMNARVSMAKLLTKNGVAPEDWSKVSGLFSPLIEGMGKQHYFEQDGLKYVQNSYSGEVEMVFDPRTAPKEHMIAAAMAAVPKEILPLLATWDQKTQEDYLLKIAARNQEMDDIDFKLKKMTLQDKTLEMNGKLLTENLPKAKGQIYQKFHNDFIETHAKDMISYVKLGQMKSEEALTVFDQQISAWMTSPGMLGLMANAKMGPDDLVREMAPIIDNYKQQIKLHSGDTRDARKLAELEVQNKIKMEEVFGQLSPGQLAKLKMGSSLQGLIMTQMYMTDMIEKEQTNLAKGKKQTPSLMMDVHLALERAGKAEEARVSKVAPEDVENYRGEVLNLIRDYTTLKEENGYNQVSVLSVLNRGLIITQHPQWANFKKADPQAAKIIEDNVAELNTIKP